MNETTKDEPTQENGHQDFTDTTAVRVYDSANSVGDFPVLKAFQEYLDAEQAKAHKRMLSLSIFFIVLLVIVVLTFSIITSSLISRSQSLSDRLMDLAKERLNAPVVQPAPAAAPIVNVQQPPVATPAMDNSKPILAKLEALEAELARTRAAAAQADSSIAKPTPATVAPKTPSGKSQAELDTLVRQQEEIQRQQEALKAAREKLKAEQDALHKEEVERHRRKLYPEYYAQEDARRAQEEAAKNPPPALPAVNQPALPATGKPVPPAAPAAARQPALPAAVVPAAAAKPLSKQQADLREIREIEKILEKVDETDVSLPPPQPKDKPKDKPKDSALKAILDQDDVPKAPKTTSEKSKLSDEEKKKAEAELKEFQKQLDKLEAEEKKAGDAQQKQKPAAAPVVVDKSPSPTIEALVPQVPASKPQAPKTESLNVGAKDGKSIPWLVEIPGETVVDQKEAGKPEPKAGDDKKSQPQLAK